MPDTKFVPDGPFWGPLVTQDQLRGLRAEASQAGDFFMEAICAVALDDMCPNYSDLTKPQRQCIYAMTIGEARLRCAQVIARTVAQVSL